MKSFIYALGFHFIEERYVLLASAGLHFSKWFKSSWHLLVSMLNTLLWGTSLGCHHPPFFIDVCSPQVSSWSKITACSSCQQEVNCKGQLDFRDNGLLPPVKKIQIEGEMKLYTHRAAIIHSQISLSSFFWSESHQANLFLSFIRYWALPPHSVLHSRHSIVVKRVWAILYRR